VGLPIPTSLTSAKRTSKTRFRLRDVIPLPRKGPELHAQQFSRLWAIRFALMCTRQGAQSLPRLIFPWSHPFNKILNARDSEFEPSHRDVEDKLYSRIVVV
jgi:hypothetical protein